jgi:hypothetical protein
MDRKNLLQVGQWMVRAGICLLVLHLLFYVFACREASPVADPPAGKVLLMDRKGLHGFVMPWLGHAVDWTLLAMCLTVIPGLLLVGLARRKKGRS